MSIVTQHMGRITSAVQQALRRVSNATGFSSPFKVSEATTWEEVNKLSPEEIAKTFFMITQGGRPGLAQVPGVFA